MNELHSEKKNKIVLNAVLLIIAVYLAFIFAEQYHEMYPYLVEAEQMELIQQNFERNVSALSSTNWNNSAQYKTTSHFSNPHSYSSISVNSNQSAVYSASVFENTENVINQLFILDNDFNKNIRTRRSNIENLKNSFQIQTFALNLHGFVLKNQYISEQVMAVESEIAEMQRPFSAPAEDDPEFPGDPGELPLSDDLIVLLFIAGFYALFIHFKLRAK